MAKKAKDAAVAAAPVATTPAPVPPAANAPGSLRAAMKSMKVAAAPVVESAGGPDEVKIDDPVLLQKINQLIEESAKQRAAEGRKASLDADIRPSLITKWFEKCRSAKSFIKTIKCNGLLNFGSPQLSIGKPNLKADPPLTKDGIADGLIAFFGDLYSKYIKETFTLKVKSERTTQADMQFLQQALDRVELTDASTDVLIALVTEAMNKKKSPELETALTELKTRKARVQGKTFAEMFDFEFGLGFVEEKVGDEKIVVLKRDMALSADFEKKVREGIAQGLLALNDGSITPNGDAVAAAEQRIVAEEVKRLNQNTVANAAAAGAAAGAALAAKSA